MGLPPETASFRVTEGYYGMPFFIVYPKSELPQFLPNKGVLEPFGHEFFPKQAGDILRSGTSGKKILHPLAGNLHPVRIRLYRLRQKFSTLCKLNSL